jgi:sugar phosphate isomerase/epimerase
VALQGSLRLVGSTLEDRAQLAALAPWAEAIGVRWLRVFDGGKNGDAAELAAAAETLRWWGDLRTSHGWRTNVMVETHDSLFTAERIQRFVAVVPEIALLWDAHHTWRKGVEDPLATWTAVGDRVVHVHVKDSIDLASARHPFTYVLPGDGEFPIARTLTALRADRYEGAVSLEWEKAWHPYLPSLGEALTVARARKWW